MGKHWSQKPKNSNHDWKQPKTGHFSLMQENYCKYKTLCRMISNWVIHNNAGVSWPMWEIWYVCIFWTIYSTLII